MATPRKSAAAVKTSKIVKKMAAKKGASPVKEKPTAKPMARRADYGAPVDAFFAKQPESHRAILEPLRKLVEKTIPKVESSLKWGMPMFTLGGKMVCGLGAHKAHVNLILAGPSTIFIDPKGLLQGEGKTGRRLVLQSKADLPPEAVLRAWIVAAAKHAAS